MKIYKCIAKNRQEALRQAIDNYGVNIQIVYEREFLYGIFNRKWIELGFFDKDVQEAEGSGSSIKYTALELPFDLLKIQTSLMDNDFSKEYVNELTDKVFIHFSQKDEAYSRKNISKFLLREIDAYIDKIEMRTLDSFNNLLYVLSPFEINRNNFLKHLIERFENTKLFMDSSFMGDFVIINYNRNDECDHPRVKVINVSTNEELADAYKKFDNRFLIINCSCATCRDISVQTSIENILRHNMNQDGIILVPSFIKYTEAIKSLKLIPFDSFVFTSYDFDGTVGNMLSLAKDMNKKMFLLDMENCALTCNPKDLLKQIVL